jgi:hypothetical protein
MNRISPEDARSRLLASYPESKKFLCLVKEYGRSEVFLSGTPFGNYMTAYDEGQMDLGYEKKGNYWLLTGPLNLAVWFPEGYPFFMISIELERDSHILYQRKANPEIGGRVYPVPEVREFCIRDCKGMDGVIKHNFDTSEQFLIECFEEMKDIKTLKSK